jgi:hypothetical protein
MRGPPACADDHEIVAKARAPTSNNIFLGFMIHAPVSLVLLEQRSRSQRGGILQIHPKSVTGRFSCLPHVKVGYRHQNSGSRYVALLPNGHLSTTLPTPLKNREKQRD